MKKEEQARLNEILFYKWIHRLYNDLEDPMKLLNLMDVFIELTQVEPVMIKSAIQRVLADDQDIRPKRHETVYLMKQAGIPIKEIKITAQIAQNTYYSYTYKDTPVVEPKFSVMQRHEMVNLMKGVQETVRIVGMRGVEHESKI